MLTELLRLLPAVTGTVAVYAALGACVGGLGMWLVGARFSQAILTLFAVFVGAAAGKQLPAWFGWTIDGMGPAVGLAVVLGVWAFAMHRMWVGMALGTMLMLWAAIGTWIVVGHGEPWSLPAIGTHMSLPGYVSEIWKSVPADIGKVLPWACAGAFLCGLVPSIIWPRMATPVLYSVTGLTLALPAAGMIASSAERAWLTKVKLSDSMQAGVLGAAVLVGVAVQWWFMPRRASAARVERDDDEMEERPARRKAA